MNEKIRLMDQGDNRIIGQGVKGLKNLLSFYPINLLSCLFSSLVFILFGSYPVYGGSGAAFLKIPVGASAIGMGSAYTAMALDHTALYWNPAGLHAVNQKELGFMHAELFEGTQLEFIGLALPLNSNKQQENKEKQKKRWGLGMGVTYLHQESLDGRDENRNKTQTFSASDFAATFAGGAKISKRTSLGLSAKILRQQIEANQSYGWAMDFGILTQIPKLNLGVSLLNFGPAMKFLDEHYSLPITLSLGTAYRLNSWLNFSLDWKHYLADKNSSLGYGMEVLLTRFVSLRAGYLTSLAELKNSKAGDQSLKQIAGLNTGMGLKFQKCQLDYAFTPMGNLGQAHRFSLTYKF